jgi:hypothetical protein
MKPPEKSDMDLRHASLLEQTSLKSHLGRNNAAANSSGERQESSGECYCEDTRYFSSSSQLTNDPDELPSGEYVSPSYRSR